MDDFSDDINTTGVLTADGTVTTGSLEIANDVDWFALEVTQGEIYQIEFTSSTIASGLSDLGLFDTNGNFLQDGSDVLTFEAQTTGTVFLEADIFGSRTGGYELTTNLIEDDFSDDVNTTGVLTTDGIFTAGAVDFVGDGDWFAIDLVAGELYSIALSAVGVGLRLRDSSGNIVASGTDSGDNDVVTFTPSETGTFYVEALSSRIGNYSLTAVNVGDVDDDDFSQGVNTTGVLTSDGTVTAGSIEIANDRDSFALEVTQGELYSVTFTGLSSIPLSHGDINLFDSNRNFLLDGTTSLTFAALTTGIVSVSYTHLTLPTICSV